MVEEINSEIQQERGEETEEFSEFRALGIRLPREMYRTVCREAAKNRRSKTGQVEYWLRQVMPREENEN